VTAFLFRFFRSRTPGGVRPWYGLTAWWLVIAGIVPALLLAPAGRAGAEATRPTTPVAYLGKRYAKPPPLSLLEKELTDEGVQGARLGIRDDNVTGTFIGRHYELTEIISSENEDVIAKAKAALAEGYLYLIADLEAQDLLAVADLPEAADAIILDVRTGDDELRQESCRANVFHILPNWAMRADALGQFLAAKHWSRWFLIEGKTPADQQYAAAVKRSASRFGAKVVAEQAYAFEAGQRRVDSGHQQIQTQMPMLTHILSAYDVVFVTDVAEAFGEYLLFNTFDPRPVVGTHGLVAVAWHRAFEQYSGTQLQHSFEKFAGRIMTESDYAAWLAARIVGEGITRTNGADIREVRNYLLSDRFEVAGFKGQGMTFRRWDHQLRQPILVSGPRALVSVSPQEGFLHPKFYTDTLGFDEPETKCRFKQ
jgi:ABC transporter substrate binding protein (PQQ-dependent alcohol dehydrogenase system)